MLRSLLKIWLRIRTQSQYPRRMTLYSSAARLHLLERWNTPRSLLPLKPNERNQNQKEIHENSPKIVLIYVECALECSFFGVYLSCLSIWHSEQHFVWFNVHHIIWELRRCRCRSIQTIVSFSCSFNFPFGHLKIENVFWPSTTTTMEMQWPFAAC